MKRTLNPSKRDMRGVYRGLYEKHPEGFPEVLVFEDLGEDNPIAVRLEGEDCIVFYVKDASDKEIVDMVYNAILHPESWRYLDDPIWYHGLSREEVAKWSIYASYIADALGVPLGQIVFAEGGFIDGSGSGYSDEHPFMFIEVLNRVEMLIGIAHELRHSWQHKNCPELFEGYMHPEDGEDEYLAQEAEIDAEAYGIKVESLITGVDFINSQAGVEMPPEYRRAISERMPKIDVVLSKKKVNAIRQLLDIEGLLRSVGL